MFQVQGGNSSQLEGSLSEMNFYTMRAQRVLLVTQSNYRCPRIPFDSFLELLKNSFSVVISLST